MLSGAWRWIKENKWKSAAAAAVVGGYIWYQRSQQGRSEAQLEKQRMTTYWRDSQLAADQTISKFVPILAKQVEQHTRLFEIVASLRNPDNDAQAKSRLFEELKIAAFTSHMLFMYSLVFIAQYMRISVNVVGRHLYASTTSPEGMSTIDMVRTMLPKTGIFAFFNATTPTPPRKVDEPDLLVITPAIRDRCLGSSEFFTGTGLPILADVVSQACIGTLANHPLDEKMNIDQLIDIIMHIRNVVEGQFWRPYEGRPGTLIQILLMSPENSSEYTFENPEDAVYSAGLDADDKARLLMNEARNVIESHAFSSLVQHSFNVGFAAMSESIANAFPKAPAPAPASVETAQSEEVTPDVPTLPSFPLAKLLPALSNHFKSVCNPKDNLMVDRVTGTNEFNEFSYRIFHGPVRPEATPSQ